VSWKVTDVDYKIIEREVGLYPLYKKELKDAVNNLILATPVHDDNGGGRSNIPSRPTEKIAMNLFENARIMQLRRYVEAIEFAYNKLDDEKQRFVTFIFWTKHDKNIQGVCKEFHIRYHTYWRWKKAFLLQVGLITGIYRGDIYQ